MSRAELMHRMGEQIKRRSDAVRNWGWDGFGKYESTLIGLPCLAFPHAAPAILAAAAETAARVREGRLAFLGQDWPGFDDSRWWLTNAWTLDPVSSGHWPGSEAFAFSVDYRHRPGLGDVKFVWELNRLQFLAAMALAAAATPDGAGRSGDVLAIIGGWMEANPPYRGVNWTNGIELATRVVAVLAALVFLPAEQIPAAEGKRLLAFFEAHAYWLDRYPSLHSSANNHRVAELAALFLVGSCVPGLPEAGRYREAGRAGLEREMLRQFHPDGVGAEQSPTYAAYSLEWFVLSAAAGDATGRPFSDAFRERGAAAAVALRWMLDGGGHAPRIGDDDEGRVLALGLDPEPRYVSSVVALAQRWLGRPQPPPAFRDPALRDLVKTDEASVEPSSPLGFRFFENGGYSVSRSPNPLGLVLFVFDHGPLGFGPIAAHGHADALSVWLHWGDEPVLVDAGTFLYHAGGDWRTRFRGTAAHNTLTVGDRDQSRMTGAFNWAQQRATTRVIAASESEVIAEHDGYAAAFGVIHRRSVRFLADAFVIEDSLRVADAAAAGTAWTLGFTFAPGISVALEARREANAVTPGGRRLRLIDETPGGAGPLWEVGEGVFSAAFNVRTDAARLIASERMVAGETTVSRIRIALEPARQPMSASR